MRNFTMETFIMVMIMIMYCSSLYNDDVLVGALSNPCFFLLHMAS